LKLFSNSTVSVSVKINMRKHIFALLCLVAFCFANDEEDMKSKYLPSNYDATEMPPGKLPFIIYTHPRFEMYNSAHSLILLHRIAQFFSILGSEKSIWIRISTILKWSDDRLICRNASSTNGVVRFMSFSQRFISIIWRPTMYIDRL